MRDASIPRTQRRVWIAFPVVAALMVACNGFEPRHVPHGAVAWAVVQAQEVVATDDGGGEENEQQENGDDGNEVGDEEEGGGHGYAHDQGYEGGYHHKSLHDLSERTGQLCDEHQDFLQTSENMMNRNQFYELDLMFNPMSNVRSLQNCTDPTEIARGSYFSTNDCTFAYHKNEHAEKWSDFRLSTGCTESNMMTETLEDGRTRKSSFPMKVSPFPDQCVKNFRRCYSIEHDWKHYLAFVCKNYVSIPDEATHLSVDCRKDFLNTLRNQNDTNLNPYEKKERESMEYVATRTEKIIYGVMTAGFAGCFVCVCVFYFMVVRPYQQSHVLESGLRRRRTGVGARAPPRLPFMGLSGSAARRRHQAKATSV
jgi:hypothetical protein